jgi:glycosyltransferase involved in cell wall biosynthesis
MRPYLASRRLRNILVWIAKTALIWLLNKRRNIEIAKLSIPFQRIGKRSYRWVRDDLTLIPLRKRTEKDAIRKLPRELLDFSYVLVGGFLDTRKDPSLAVEGFRGSDWSRSDRTKIAFIGEMSPQYLERLRPMMGDDLFVLNEYLERDRYYAVLENASVIVLPYSNKGASGIALEALTLGTPVVMCNTKFWKQAYIATEGLLAISKPNNFDLSKAIDGIVSKDFPNRFGLAFDDNLPTIVEFMLDLKDWNLYAK